MRTRALLPRRRTTAGLLLAAGLAACGGDTAEPAAPAAPAASAPVVGPTAARKPAATALADSATCADFLDATGPARENATRAALIVVRHDAGLPREPAPEVRAAFESAVDDACREQRSARMLDVMNTVVERDRQAYLG